MTPTDTVDTAMLRLTDALADAGRSADAYNIESAHHYLQLAAAAAVELRDCLYVVRDELTGFSNRGLDSLVDGINRCVGVTDHRMGLPPVPPVEGSKLYPPPSGDVSDR